MATTDSSTPALPSESGSAVSWFASWIVILLLLGLLARSNWGKPIVYYVAWLTVVILALTHAPDLAALINGRGTQITNG